MQAIHIPDPSWIALADNIVEGQYVWQAGPEVGRTLNSTGFVNWLAGQPDNFSDNEDCICRQFDYIGAQNTFAWNDVSCTLELFYIVESECVAGPGFDVRYNCTGWLTHWMASYAPSSPDLSFISQTTTLASTFHVAPLLFALICPHHPPRESVRVRTTGRVIPKWLATVGPRFCNFGWQNLYIHIIRIS